MGSVEYLMLAEVMGVWYYHGSKYFSPIKDVVTAVQMSPLHFLINAPGLCDNAARVRNEVEMGFDKDWFL